MEPFREDFPALNFNFSQLIRDNVEEALSGVKGANSVKLFGSDLDVLEEVGQKVANILRSVRGIENVGLFHILGQPNLEIQIDREACARYGINVSDVEAAVQVAIGGRAFSRMVEGEKLYDIVLRLPEDLRDDPKDISRIAVDVPGSKDRAGARIPLSQLATIIPHKPGASFIYRENNRRFVPIKFSVRNRDLASAIGEAQAKVKAAAVVPESRGYRIAWSGEFAQMEAANTRLMWIVPLSIALILCLLYTAFSSMKDALLVMANVVAATMGGVWALTLTQTPFSISAAVGFISIFGVAVQDGVLLISYFNQMRGEGMTGPRRHHARGRAPGAPGRDDVAHRRARPFAGGARHVDRVASPETAGDRGRRRDARDVALDALPDAGALQLLPGPAKRTAGDRRGRMRLTETSTRQAPEPASTASEPEARSAKRRRAQARGTRSARRPARGRLPTSSGPSRRRPASAWSSLKASLSAPPVPAAGPSGARSAQALGRFRHAVRTRASVDGHCNDDGQAADRTDPARAARHHRVRFRQLDQDSPPVQGPRGQGLHDGGQDRKERRSAHRSL